MFSDQHIKEKIQYGSFVRLTGLVGSKKYNGYIGRVENEHPVEDSKGILRHQVALVDLDKTLQVRPANIVVSNDSSKWNRWECNDETLLEFLRNKNNSFHSMDVCHKFGAEIWKLFFDPATSVSLPKEYSEEFKQMLVSSPKNGHSIVIINLSAVAHVCVIEIRETKGNVRFRIYQSYINQKVNIASSCGYTIGQWCSPCSPTSDLQSNEAHKRYGGGKTLNAAEMCSFIDLIHEWQNLTVEILAEELLIQVPEKILPRNLIPYLASRDRNWLQANQKLFLSVTTAINDWSLSLANRIMKEGITSYGFTFGELDSSDVKNISICIGSEVLFTISSERYLRCNDVNMSMTGQCISGAVFLKMLQQGIFWEVRAHVDSNGINQFLGFTYQAGKLVDRR